MTRINLKVIDLTQPGLENASSGLKPMTFGFPNLPELEADALFIQLPWLVPSSQSLILLLGGRQVLLFLKLLSSVARDEMLKDWLHGYYLVQHRVSSGNSSSLSTYLFLLLVLKYLLGGSGKLEFKYCHSLMIGGATARSLCYSGWTYLCLMPGLCS